MEKKSMLGRRDSSEPKMIMVQVQLLLMHLLHFIFRHLYALIYYFKKPRSIPPDDNPLFKLSATKLAKKIREGELTSQEIVKTYIDRIRIVNPYINAVIDNRFKDAIIEAKLCDTSLKEGRVTAATLEKEKPLYGVPITVKESCSLKGLSYTAGTLARKGVKASEDGAAVEILKNAGAIPLCVTNTPEMCSSLQTTNFLFGTTVNPYDTRRTPGGSSGGEGALIGAGASILGIGSDLLGSIKVPSLFTGIFGHKPSPDVVPVKGHYPMVDDLEFQKFTGLGPMARYAEDLLLAMKVLSSKCEKPLRLDDPVDIKKLRVFYVQSFDSPFGVRATTSDIRQAIRDAVRRLEKYGVVAKELSQDWVRDMVYITLCFFGNIELPSPLLDAEHPGRKKDAMHEFIKAIFGMSQFTLPLTMMALFEETDRYVSQTTVKHYNNVKQELSERFKDLLKDDGIFICPTYPQPAPFPQLIPFQCDYGAYGGFANMLHLPSTHVPMGLNTDGLPIGFQVMAAPYQDRLCLAVAKELERAFGGWESPAR